MKDTADRLVDGYLKRLDRELSDLPRARRAELGEEIAGHIAEARAQLPAESEVEIRNLLERLGDPADIAAEERARPGVQPGRAGAVEILALIGLLVGGFIFFVGWFAGLVFLWVSEAWTTREKLVGTFVVPGGLMLAFLLFAVGGGAYGESCGGEIDPVTKETVNMVCEGGPSLAGRIFWITLFVIAVVGPFFTTFFLTRRMRRPRPAAYQPSPGSA